MRTLIMLALILGGCQAAVSPIRPATIADPYEKQRHAHDNGECVSYGLKIGTPDYVTCRERLETVRLQRAGK